MNIDLNSCFPESTAGVRGPLPKQSEFLRMCLSKDPSSPRYIAYVGGIGSGKTLIGTIAVLAWAIMYPGDYLISRQYMPELKATTLKTFLEICPPELIEEYRVADSIIRIKGVGGKISTIFFRQLEEYFKLKSMNLSGFLIDEGDQVSEEAFNMLQGRLRGGGIRKGIIVSNPNGHDWLYRWFYQKANLTGDWIKSQYQLVRAPSTENIHLPDDYLTSLMASWSGDRIKKEIEGSFDAFEGAVYEEFNRAYHVIKPFKIPDEWPKYVGIDHGYRNPAAWIWTAIGPDGEVYVYREFYQAGWLIKEIVNGDKPTQKLGVTSMMAKQGGYEKISRLFIDPSTRAKRGTNGQSDWDEYVRCLPEQFQLQKANNAVQLGIDRVKSYLKIHTKTGKPSLFIFDTCYNLIEEITQYKYPDLKPNQEGKKAENEKPVKVNDHALDALRYVVVTLPEPYEVPKSAWKAGGLSGVVQAELAAIHTPVAKDPFGD